MEKFSKELALRMYSKISIVMSMGLLYILFKYFNEFPKLMNGEVKKQLFSLDFTMNFSTHLEIFNFALVVFIVVLFINLGILIYALVGEKIDEKIVANIMYNTIITVLIIIAHGAFYYMIPDTVNGAIEIGLFQYEFDVLTGVSNKGINFAYILILIYMLYNATLVYLEMRTIKKNNQEEIVVEEK